MYSNVKKSEAKKLIVFLEGTLINFTPNYIVKDSKQETKEQGLEDITKRGHFIYQVNSNKDVVSNRYFEYYTRPYAQWFIQVCSTRFNIYIIHRCSETVLKHVMNNIDTENRIKHHVRTDSNNITPQLILKSTKRQTIDYTSTVVISPLVCLDTSLKDIYYTIPIYEYSDKDYELKGLTLLLEYLAVEEDIRPIRLKFHTYPTGQMTEAVEGLVETDEDIANMFDNQGKFSLKSEETMEQHELMEDDEDYD